MKVPIQRSATAWHTYYGRNKARLLSAQEKGSASSRTLPARSIPVLSGRSHVSRPLSPSGPTGRRVVTPFTDQERLILAEYLEAGNVLHDKTISSDVMKDFVLKVAYEMSSTMYLARAIY